MRSANLPRRLLPALCVILSVPLILAAQSGQSTTGTTGTTGTSTTAGSSNAGTGSVTGTTSRGSRSGTGSTGTRNTESQLQLQRHLPLFVTGMVVLEDGTPPPFGVVIERICYGRSTKEAYADSSGGFGFILGANNTLMYDASDPSPPTRPGGAVQSMNTMGADIGAGASLRMGDCDLRAQLGGHRSSTVPLRTSQVMGSVDVGTIVLYPAVKVRGTMTSFTSLSAPKEARKAFERGEKALQQRKFAEAEKNLGAAVAAYAKYAAAWFQLGQAFQRMERNADARDAFNKALEADAHYVGPYIGLAQVAAVEQKWQEAADLSERGVTLDPLDFPEGFYLNAVANYNLQNFDQAERSARKAQRLDPLHQLPGSHLILAYILERRKEFAGEMEQLRAYLKYAPDGPSAARARTRLGELEKTAAPATPVAKKRP
jgi:tetratricopeptide (TPR) repeat protein